MAISSIDQLEKKLKTAGFKDIKKVTGRRLAVLTNENRVSVLEQVESILVRDKAIYDRTPISSSSVGIVKVGQYAVFAKPASAQGAKSAGIDNEIVVINAINQYVELNGGVLDVTFKSGSKRFTRKNIAQCIEMGRDTSGRKKADIILVSNRGIQTPISIKKDNAETWESADSYYGPKAKQVLDELWSEGKIKMDKDASGIYKLEPNVAVPATSAEKREVVFGSDLERGGSVITRTFSERDFKFDGKKGELTIEVSSIITQVSDVTGSKDVYFLIRNDKTRNTPSLYRGIRVLAVYKSRVNPRVLIYR